MVLGLRRGLVDQEVRVLYRISQLRDRAPGSCGSKLHLCRRPAEANRNCAKVSDIFFPGTGVIFRM